MSIGADTLVGRDAVVSRSVVWEGCVVGDGAFVDRSMLADRVVVGPHQAVYSTVKVGAEERTYRRGAGRRGRRSSSAFLPSMVGRP